MFFLRWLALALFGSLYAAGALRGRRYALYKYRSSKCSLSFRFRDPHQLFKNQAEYQTAKSTITEAFKIWERASGHRLSFVDLSDISSKKEEEEIDIDILFARGAHGCVENLDGAGNIVAHSAYLPNGLIHFDADEAWNIDGLDSSGPDLRYVALHEIGHVLGIKHSSDRNSVMSPFYRDRRQKGFNVSNDDVEAIRDLYSHCKFI